MTVRAPHALVAAVCVGIASANAARLPSPHVAAGAVALAGVAALVDGQRRLAVLVAALACAGWWWGSVRLAALDRSVLASSVGTSERALLEVTAPPRNSRFQVRVTVVVRRFGRRRVHEAALLELPPGRAPPQGGLVSAVVTVEQPHGPEQGFDERTWLRHKGVHVRHARGALARRGEAQRARGRRRSLRERTAGAGETAAT